MCKCNEKRKLNDTDLDNAYQESASFLADYLLVQTGAEWDVLTLPRNHKQGRVICRTHLENHTFTRECPYFEIRSANTRVNTDRRNAMLQEYIKPVLHAYNLYVEQIKEPVYA